MCGIFLTVNQDVTEKDLLETTKSLQARGPDRYKYVNMNANSTAIHLLFYRLCINDLSPLGDQPFMNDDHSIALMCNGEIYNHKYLEKSNEIQPKSKSDCEVLLHLYEMYPKNFECILKQLNADFALIIVDLKRNRVILSRDRVGVRPLYYSSSPHFSASSDLKSLRGKISHVKPGQMLIFDLLTQKYKTLTYFTTENVLTKTMNPIFLKSYLINAVISRLDSDRPIGALLSGGLDSSIVCALLVKALGAKNVRTYSIGMKGSTDLHYANIVAKHLGTEHTEVLFTPEEGLAVIPEVIRTIETFDITTVRASVGMYLLSKYISSHTEDKVIFSGEGSDELLCGYLYFHNAPSGDAAHRESLRLLSELYLYDCLRADKCVSSHGLELRVPFLDKDVLFTGMQIHGELKRPYEGLEKRILREQFSSYLPSCVINRRKDGFSDGVSSLSKPWYEHIEEHVNSIITDDEFLESKEISKEALWYKKIYLDFFPYHPLPIVKYWMPRWSEKTTNPSGRVVPLTLSSSS